MSAALIAAGALVVSCLSFLHKINISTDNKETTERNRATVENINSDRNVDETEVDGGDGIERTDISR
jgi:hypothetical protein